MSFRPKEITAKTCYPEIYAMEPAYEKEPGWWKLKWRPIFGPKGTYAVYWMNPFMDHCGRWWKSSRGLGVKWGFHGAHNGWNRSYECFAIEFILLFGSLNFWIKWNYVVHKDGPMDGGEPVPLTLPGAF